MRYLILLALVAARRTARPQIEVGDLIVINNRESVPCDVLIMGVDEAIPESPAGVAYVETKSLDGETNLKIRQVCLVLPTSVL